MRIDKLTTKFQEALADAQSLAVGQDHPYIEPAHILSALLSQADGSTTSLLQRAGVNLQRVQSGLHSLLDSMPAVQGALPARCRSAVTPQHCSMPLTRTPKSVVTNSSPAKCSCWRWPKTRARPAVF